MYEYMRGLQRQFFKEPDFPELRQELNELHQELIEDKPKEERRKLLKPVDLEAELRDEISLASFAAGFRLAWGNQCGTEHGATLFLRRGRRAQDRTACGAEEG